MKKKIFIIGTAIACMLPMIFPFSAQATELNRLSTPALVQQREAMSHGNTTQPNRL